MTLIAVRTVRRGDALTLASLSAPTMIPTMTPLDREVAVAVVGASIPTRNIYSPTPTTVPAPRSARSHIALEVQ